MSYLTNDVSCLYPVKSFNNADIPRLQSYRHLPKPANNRSSFSHLQTAVFQLFEKQKVHYVLFLLFLLLETSIFAVVQPVSDSIFIKMKRFITIFMLAILIPCIVSAQQQTEVYRSVEQMPRYPDGEAELMKYIMANINFPETCAEGIVVAQFVVEADGRIGEVKVVRSIDQLLDEEAVRVIKSLPNFVPGYHNGQPVAVWYTIPVRFSHPHQDGCPVYHSTREIPSFPGGDGAMMKYIHENIKMTNCSEQPLVGRIVAQFLVKSDGSIGEVRIIKSLSPEFDKEFVRIIKSFPKFTPARYDGVNVPVWFTLSSFIN